MLSTYPEYDVAYDLFSKKFGVDKSRMLVTNGSDEAIRITYNTYISEGDKIVIPTPTFAIFNLEAALYGADVLKVPYNDDLSFPEKAVIESSKGARMTVVVTPNNPTGTSASTEAIGEIAKRAELVFVDEAYCEFNDTSAISLIDKYDNVIVAHTFSKAYGLAGLRIGLVFANENIISTLKKVISPYSVNTLAIECAMTALEDQEHMRSCVSEILKARDYIMSELRSLGFKVYDSDANFIICDLGKEHDKVVGILDSNNILIRDRTEGGILKNCIRLSAGTMEESKILINTLKNHYGAGK